jgi:site-specific DNA recombinase
MPSYASLVRVSTKAQASDKRHGVPNQLKANKEFAERHNLTISKEYVDAITGMTESREAFFQLLSEAENYEGVIIYNVRRLGRDEEVSHKLLRLLLESGLTVYSTDRGFEPLKRDFRTAMEIALSAEERRNMLRTTQLGLLAEAQKGKLPNGIHLFGYQNVPGKNEAVIHPLEAEVVREVFELAAKGESYRAIAKEMMRRGRKTMKGRSVWYQHTARRIVLNSAYKGEFLWNWKDEYSYVLSVPPIVAPELWQRAQRHKVGAKEKLGFPLSGHLKCGICGLSLSARKVNNRFPYYRCNSSKEPRGKCGLPFIRREGLESEVEQKLRQLLSDEATLRDMFAASLPTELDAATLQRIRSLRSEEARLLEMAQRGMITLDDAETRVHGVRAKIQALETVSVKAFPLSLYKEKAQMLSFKELLDYCNVTITVYPENKFDLLVKF